MRRWFLSLFLVTIPAMLPATPTGAGQFTTTNGPVYNGTRAVVDLPGSQHMKNVGGRDGAGLCVFTSIQHAARWHGLYELEGYRAYMETQPGGGWPQKVDKTLATFCAAKGVKVPDYIQHTGGDPAFLDLCIKTGRCPGVTYAGVDNFYRGRIAHMVNLAHLDNSIAAIIDNNRPGQWVWMNRNDFVARWHDMDGGWAFVFLAPPPAPYPATPQEVGGGCPCGRDCDCNAAADCGHPDCPGIPGCGQCPNGRCPNSRPDAPGPKPIGNPPGPDYQWRFLPGVGWGWVHRSVPVPPELPKEMPGPLTEAGTGFPNGVNSSRIHDHPRYSINGRACTEDEALSRLGGLADDSGNWFVVAVGDSTFTGRVRLDVAGLPIDVRSKLHVVCYTPDVWQVSQFRLPAGVSLRRPAVGRVGPDVGVIPPDQYSAGKLADLMGKPGGPAPKVDPPTPPQPPVPNPGPNDPPVPPSPGPTPNPNPDPGPTPTPAPTLPLWLTLGGILAAIWYFRRK
jgi:hypothetical protein